MHNRALPVVCSEEAGDPRVRCCAPMCEDAPAAPGVDAAHAAAAATVWLDCLALFVIEAQPWIHFGQVALLAVLQKCG